jgi:subtilisin family serine protease
MGAHVMNNSWGGGGPSHALKDAITAAHIKGILFAAAAGNANNDNDANPFYPAGYDVPNVISVMSTDQTDAKSSFSNFGKMTVHLGAPGTAIHSTLPNSQYGSLSGTSRLRPSSRELQHLSRRETRPGPATKSSSTLMETVDKVHRR